MERQSFELIQVSPTYQDCTCKYDVVIPENYTLYRFISDILIEHSGDRGSIEITNEAGLKSSGRYNCGNVDILPNFDFMLNRRVLSATAHGGYTIVDYKIIVE